MTQVIFEKLLDSLSSLALAIEIIINKDIEF